MRMATQRKTPSEDPKRRCNATMIASWSTMALSHFDWNITRRIHFRTTSSSLLKHQRGKEIIIGHPASVRLGLIQVLCENHAKTVSSIEADQTNNLFWVHNINRKTQRPKRSSSGLKSDRRRRSSESASGQIESRRTKESLKCQMEHPYSTNNHTCSSFSSFQDQNPWQEEEKWQNKLTSRPLIQSMTKRVRELNSKYYLPTNEQTQIISEPARASQGATTRRVTRCPTTSVVVQPNLCGAR